MAALAQPFVGAVQLPVFERGLEVGGGGVSVNRLM